jgi:hypothetical protein
MLESFRNDSAGNFLRLMPVNTSAATLSKILAGNEHA